MRNSIILRGGIAISVMMAVGACAQEQVTAVETATTAEATPVAAVVGDAAQPAAEAPVKKGLSTKLLGFDSVKSERTTITAERMEFDYKEMVAVFDEKVHVENTQFLMLADRVLVFLDGTNEVKQLLAIGHVALTNENRNAACDRAVYTRETEQIILTGNARLSRDGDSIKGDRITIWLADERMEVSPSTFVISPGTLKSSGKDEGLPKK